MMKQIRKQESEHRRSTPVTARLDAQQKNLNLLILPTTTIGSFPQTPNLRRVRREYKASKISEEESIKAMKKESARSSSSRKTLTLMFLCMENLRGKTWWSTLENS